MVRVLLLIAVLVLAGCNMPPMPNVPSPGGAVAQPSPDMQRAMEGLRAVMSGKPQAAQFGADWRDLHAVMAAGGVQINTNQQLRDVTDRFSALLLTQRYAGKPFTGFTDARNAAMTQVFSNSPVSIDPAKAADFVLGVAWACGG